MNITKRNRLIDTREQTSGYHWGEGKGKGPDRGMGLRGTDYYV